MSKTNHAIKAASLISRQRKRNKNSVAAGAYLKGPKHTAGGIKVINKSTGEPLEVEGGEAVITAPALSDNSLHEFEGKQMTKRQILSAINVDAGGVAFATGGKIRKKMKVKYCSKQYKYGGKTMSGKDIISDCGCQHKMATGGQTHSKLLTDIAALKLPAGYKAYEGHPQELLHYIQDQATGMDATRKTVSSVGYHSVVKMFGKKIVIASVKALSNQEKIFLLQQYKENKIGIDPALKKALQTKTMESGGALEKQLSPDELFVLRCYEGYKPPFRKKGIAQVLHERGEWDKPTMATVDALIEGLKQKGMITPQNSLSDKGKKTVTEAKEKHGIGKTFLPTSVGEYQRGWVEKLNTMESGGVTDTLSFNEFKSKYHRIYGYKNPQGRKEWQLSVPSASGYKTFYSVKENPDDAYKDMYDTYKIWVSKGSKAGGFNLMETGGILEKQIAETPTWELESKLKLLQKEKEVGNFDDNTNNVYFAIMAEINKRQGEELRKNISVPDSIRNNDEPGNSLQYQHYKYGGMMAKGGPVSDGEMDIIEFNKLTKRLRPFVPTDQIKALVEIFRAGEESSFAVEKAKQLAEYFEKMPKTYETENQETDDKIVYLHYFYGGSDWYIVEKDRESEQLQAFGYAILNQDYEMAEWGYISIVELMSIRRIELDFYFTPKPFKEVKQKWDRDETVVDDFVPRKDDGRFFYGERFNVPFAYSSDLKADLQKYGFNLSYETKGSIDIDKAPGKTITVSDNGGEFSILNTKDRYAHITSIAYDRTDGIARPADLAGLINDIYDDYFENKDTKKVSIASETITTPTQTDEEEEELKASLFPDHSPSRGRELKKAFEAYYSYGIQRKYQIKNYDFEGYELHLEFEKGQGSLDLGRNGTPHSYTPNNYDRLKDLRLLLINLINRSESSALEIIENRNVKGEPERESASISEIAAANPGRVMIVKPTPNTGQQATVSASKQTDINNQIRNLVKQKGADRSKYSAEELALLRLYEGAGAEKKTSSDVRILDQFFTPMDIVAKMWGLAFRHGFTYANDAAILEPAVGSGRFLSVLPAGYTGYVRAYDVDETAVTICKVLYPAFDIRLKSFETEFFRGRTHIGLAGVTQFYDLVIGNPPYREYVSEYAPLGEKKATGASTFEMYFIDRGVDVLKPGGLLIYIIPNTFMSNDSKYNDFKEKLAKKADLVDAYRLPNGVFGNTDVGTDIIVLRKK